MLATHQSEDKNDETTSAQDSASVKKNIVVIKYRFSAHAYTIFGAGIIAIHAETGAVKRNRCVIGSDDKLFQPNLLWKHRDFENFLVNLQLNIVSKDAAAVMSKCATEAIDDVIAGEENLYGEFHSLASRDDDSGLSKFLTKTLTSPLDGEIGNLDLKTDRANQNEFEESDSEDVEALTGSKEEIFDVKLNVSPIKGIPSKKLRVGSIAYLTFSNDDEYKKHFDERPGSTPNWLKGEVIHIDKSNQSEIRFLLRFAETKVGKATANANTRIKGTLNVTLQDSQLAIYGLICVIVFLILAMSFMVIALFLG